MTQTVNITSPVGRLVMGNLYTMRETDSKGQPLVYKNGAKKGQPRKECFFAVAIPKNPGEAAWYQAKGMNADGTVNEWGAKIWSVGAAAFPQACQRQDFSWKIEDGDSTLLNKANKRNCDNPELRGCWVLKFGGGFLPKVYTAENGRYVQAPEGMVKPGYFVQVNFNVEGNGSSESPGVYLNHSMVCFSAYGQEIQYGPDVNSAGFGAAPLPAGASTVPPAGAMPPPAAGAPTPPPAPLVPGVPGSVPAAAVTPPPGMASAAPAAPVPPVAPAGPTMTAKAGATTYDQFRAAGWTDEALIREGYMLAAAPVVPTALTGSAPAPAPAPIAVAPNPQFVQMPPPAVPPAAPPAAPAKALKPGVQGTYQDYINAGWTDAQLVQHGYMDA